MGTFNDGTKNDSGRWLKFQSPEELQELIDDYFEEMDEKELPYTITGLALHLDTTRETLLDYSKKERFSDTIIKAKLKIQNYAENELFRKQGQVAGIIFNLKNNYKGWKEEQTINISELDEKKKELKDFFDGPNTKDD